MIPGVRFDVLIGGSAECYDCVAVIESGSTLAGRDTEQYMKALEEGKDAPHSLWILCRACGLKSVERMP